MVHLLRRSKSPVGCNRKMICDRVFLIPMRMDGYGRIALFVGLGSISAPCKVLNPFFVHVHMRFRLHAN